MTTKRCRNQCFASQECILKRQSTHFPSCKNLDSPFLHPAVHSTKLKGTDWQNGLQARRRSLGMPVVNIDSKRTYRQLPSMRFRLCACNCLWNFKSIYSRSCPAAGHVVWWQHQIGSTTGLVSHA